MLAPTISGAIRGSPDLLDRHFPVEITLYDRKGHTLSSETQQLVKFLSVLCVMPRSRGPRWGIHALVRLVIENE